MSAVVAPKRILQDQTNGFLPKHPAAVEAKKRKIQPNGATTNGNHVSSGRVKSSFEEDLSRLTQEIDGHVEGKSVETDQRWERPDIHEIKTEQEGVTFQQIDAEESQDRGAPTIRLFGVSEKGHSVLCYVTGFLHYIYVPAPDGFRNDQCRHYQVALEQQLAQNQTVIDHVEVKMAENLYGFQGNQKSPFLKIVLTDPKYAAKVRTMYESGIFRFDGAPSGACVTFDNLPYVMRFMVDCEVTGMNWIEIPKGKYTLHTHTKLSNCQIEISVPYKDLISHSSEGKWLKMAPLRILSFDIECAGRKGIFPEPQIDPVIQIANMVTTYGESKPSIRNVFVVDTCSSIVGSQIFEHRSEVAMLSAWQKFVERVDPDVIIGYNIANFDFPYLLDRARILKVADFNMLGRLSRVASKVKETTFSSKAYGTRDSKETSIDGRLQLDLLQLIQRDYKLRSYTLNSVCAEFLGEQKEDVHHSIITELHNGTPESRRRLAVYCLKDAFLPQRLMDKLMCLVNYTEMARVTGVPFNYLLSRGQQIKVVSQLFRKAKENDLIIPNMKSEGTDEQYEGATVIEPLKGYYDVPIATLDFSSLYPSIMMAHNLCYTTLLTASTLNRLTLKKGVDYIQTPNGDLFAKPHVRKGLLPTILEDLLGARKRAKADLKKETDPFRRAVLDGRQLALKVSANSVYGFTGATVGKLPCLPISSSTTAYGREMIEKTKAEVEKRFTIANGYENDAVVVYGDTDSVMVKFGPKDLARCMELGQEAANFVSEKFIRPIKLEFEKAYFPYLLISKKRYAGLYWTNAQKHDKMDSKGIETVRRDNCRLVSNVITTVLQKILIEQDLEGAQTYVKEMISDLLQNRVDMSQLVITKALSKSDYANKQAHVELADRMRKRDAGSAPALGDRVAYVIVKGAKADRAYEKSEDPLYVLDNNIPIDTKYYLENQLSNPLQRIFEPILGERKAQSLRE